MSSELHSAYQIRWQNYRAFADTGWLTIRPITLLIGANNSGKSSVLSPLLLMNQTLSSRDSDVPLVTRGQLIDVGSYRDFVHRHQVKSDVKLAFRYHFHKPSKKVKALGHYPPGAFEVAFRQKDGVRDLELKSYQLFDIYNRHYLLRSRTKTGRYGMRGSIRTADMEAHEKTAVLNSEPINFLFSPSTALYQLERPGSNDESGRGAFSEAFSHYLKVVGFSFSQILDIFTDLSYIGPLRQRPQRYYRVAGETPKTVGSQGENAPNIVRRRHAELAADLNAWVERFEFGEKVVPEKVSDDLFSLHFQDGRHSTNIADAGFGASQVLPLIVQALAAPVDSLTVAEQPEIHLNPRLQGVLADLFVKMANTGHRVLLETHSEHLLLRLRRLVASKALSPNDVAVYYVEKEEKRSVIKEVPIQRNGHIDPKSWPKGFFDESLKESLALAAAQAKAGS